MTFRILNLNPLFNYSLSGTAHCVSQQTTCLMLSLFVSPPNITGSMTQRAIKTNKSRIGTRKQCGCGQKYNFPFDELVSEACLQLSWMDNSILPRMWYIRMLVSAIYNTPYYQFDPCFNNYDSIKTPVYILAKTHFGSFLESLNGAWPIPTSKHFKCALNPSGR